MLFHILVKSNIIYLTYKNLQKCIRIYESNFYNLYNQNVLTKYQNINKQYIVFIKFEIYTIYFLLICYLSSLKTQDQIQEQQQQQQISKPRKYKKIGNYIIKDQIGVGSFSEVNIGQHILTGELTAIKIIDKSKINDSDDVKRLQRELAIMKLVNHKNIVKLYELIDTQRHLYIIQELIQGGELFNYVVQQKRLSEQQTSKFMCQILQALHYLHTRSISHRDLKLENILLDDPKNPTQIKLIDFGLSILEVKNCKSSCGSPAYSCLQIWQNKEYDGRKCDIWSAGVCMYAMLCGCLPFQGKDSHALYASILRHRINYPNYVSQEARDMIDNMLSVDEAKRSSIPVLLQMPFITKYNKREDYYIDPQEQLINQENNLPLLDMYSLYIMKSNNFDIEKTILELKQNKYSNLTATYCLLTSQLEKQKDQQSQQIQKLLKIIKLKPIRFAQEYLKLQLNHQKQVVINDEVVAEIIKNSDKGLQNNQEMSSTQLIKDIKPQTQRIFRPQEASTETSNRYSQNYETEQQYRKYFGYINQENQFNFKANQLDQKLCQILVDKNAVIDNLGAGSYNVLFKQQNITLSIQVCRIANTNMSSLIIKRLQGDNYIYKDLAEEIMKECRR